MIKIVDPCVSNPNDIGYLKQSNATLRLKLFDTRKKLNLELSKSYGWNSKTSLSKGFDFTFKDFLNKYSKT